MVYKWCIVPQCTNTSIKTPQKLFVSVPTNPKRRTKWLKLSRRDPKSILSHTNVFMCEDHFDMEKDTINYMKYKMGFSSKILLTDEAVPTKFYCQEDRKRRLGNPDHQSAVIAKRKGMDLLKQCEEGSHVQSQDQKDDNIAQEAIEPDEAICMVAGVAVYPAGWSETAVQETCGPTADQYHLGRCHVRWAYLLAVIGCLDGAVLAALAFILATRHVRLQPDTHYPPPSLYKGEVNNGYVTDATSVSGSRKSLALQPVLIMHPHATMDMDTYSHYSGRTARSKHGIYANTMHNYQL